MKRFGELPTDLRHQTVTQGPPPSWFTPYSNYKFLSSFGSYELGAPAIETALNTKFTDEYPKYLPLVAKKYTKIDSLSPFFRYDLAKFGFGDFDIGTSTLLLGMAGFTLYYLFKPKKR